MEREGKMSAQDNVALLKKGYAAFAAGDLDTLRGMFADDIVWHSGGNNSTLSGDYKGIDETFGLFGTLFQETGGTFRNEIQHILADDDYAAAMVEMHAERNGKTFDGQGMNLFRMEDGKVKEAWVFGRDTSKLDALFE